MDLGATYILDYTEINMPQTSSVTVLDTVSNPNSLRVKASLRWAFRQASVQFGVARTGSYRDVVSVPIRTVSALTTVDTQLSYSLDEHLGKVFPSDYRS